MSEMSGHAGWLDGLLLLVPGASREYRRESGKRAGKKRISVRTRPQGVPPAFCTAGKPGCREQILEYSRVPPRDGLPPCQQVGTLPKAFAGQQLPAPAR